MSYVNVQIIHWKLEGTVCKKKNQIWVWGADRKFRPSGSIFSITRHSLVMPNSDPRDRIFYLHLTPTLDSYHLVTPPPRAPGCPTLAYLVPPLKFRGQDTGGYRGQDKLLQTQFSRAMRKCVLCHMRTTKAQISLRIRAVWSAPLLFAAYIVQYL